MRKPAAFQALTSLTVEAFRELVAPFETAFREYSALRAWGDAPARSFAELMKRLEPHAEAHEQATEERPPPRLPTFATGPGYGATPHTPGAGVWRVGHAGGAADVAGRRRRATGRRLAARADPSIAQSPGPIIALPAPVEAPSDARRRR